MGMGNIGTNFDANMYDVRKLANTHHNHQKSFYHQSKHNFGQKQI